MDHFLYLLLEISSLHGMCHWEACFSLYVEMRARLYQDKPGHKEVEIADVPSYQSPQ